MRGPRKLELYLVAAGWWPALPGYWRHVAFHWAWPLYMAVRVTRDARAGGDDYAHEALRAYWLENSAQVVVA